MDLVLFTVAGTNTRGLNSPSIENLINYLVKHISSSLGLGYPLFSMLSSKNNPAKKVS